MIDSIGVAPGFVGRSRRRSVKSVIVFSLIKYLLFSTLICVSIACRADLYPAGTSGFASNNQELKTTQFKNFSTTASLSSLAWEGETVSAVLNGSVVVQLSNRLIVKVPVSMSKEELLLLSPHAVGAWVAYEMKVARYWVVEIGSVNQIGDALKVFSSVDTVQLVQPDILQVSQKSAYRSGGKATKVRDSYLSKIIMSAGRPLGQGVNIAIIDDGFDLSHAALNHIDVRFSYDTEYRRLDSSPVLPEDTHGTQVAGVIFSSFEGAPGISPEASLIAIRQPNSWTSQTLLSFNLAKLNDADIVNCSWQRKLLLQPVDDVIQDLIATGRGGKGTVVVFSAGNGGVEIKGNMSESSVLSAFVVGASNKKGKLMKFTNRGEVVDAYIYGGAYESTLVGGGYGSFSGTSLSAAIVSGLVANLISENPEITIKEINQKIMSVTRMVI